MCCQMRRGARVAFNGAAEENGRAVLFSVGCHRAPCLAPAGTHLLPAVAVRPRFEHCPGAGWGAWLSWGSGLGNRGPRVASGAGTPGLELGHDGNAMVGVSGP